MPGAEVDRTQWMICSSVGLLVFVSFGVPLDCHWIASEPFLCARSHLGNFGVKAHPVALGDAGIDRLRRAAVGSIENLCRRSNGNSRVVGVYCNWLPTFHRPPDLRFWRIIRG